MSGIALLMGLLVLSYLGSLIGVRAGRGSMAAMPLDSGGGRGARGLPSGIEFVGLGLLVGPHVLGFVERGMISEFEPVVQAALGWLAFLVGLDFGRVEGRRVPSSAMAIGIGGAVLTGVAVAVSVYVVLGVVPVPGMGEHGAWLLAGGAGAVAAETTRFAVQWVAGRFGARGPVSDLLVELAASDDLAPLVAAGATFAIAPAHGLAVDLTPAGWFLASVALGALLGTVTALLLRGAEGYDLWGALIGTLLLGVGIAIRLGLCTIFVTFVMGVALAAVSPTRRVLRRMVGGTERAVLYPLLLLAGARLDLAALHESRFLLGLLALVLLTRICGKLVSGLVVRLLAPAARPAGGLVGLVLLSAGPVSMSCGFVFALRFPGVVGDTLLVTSVASAVLGELVSTLALQRLLAHVGEIRPAQASETRGSSRPPATEARA